MRNLAILALLLAVGGCKIEQTASRSDVPDTSATARPELPADPAAKVAAVMAAEGITLPQVASYLNTYGYDVISRANTMRIHWSPAPQGTYPIAYYVVALRMAVGDTAIAVYAPTAVGEIAGKVRAYDGHGNTGPWSASAVSGPGATLPGVVE